ncbi:MAG: nitroreductase family protein [Chloroflexi bacterium]|nr:nitroreductase family protein [Chloroflexota bacterium]
MDLFEVIKCRRSVHSFTEEELSDDKINILLEAARWAPSAGNVQPWRFVVVRKPENIEKIWEATAWHAPDITPQNFIRKASVIIVVCTDTTAYKRRQSSIRSSLFCIQDAAAATQNLLLAACGLELGACWVGMFDEDRLKEALNIPAGIRPVAIIPVGHTKSKKKPPSRKPLEDIVYHETF